MIFFLLIWSLTALGFLALSASMSKHQKQLFEHELDRSKTVLMSVIGWTILGIALVICLCAGPISNMMSYFIATLTFSACAVGLLLSYIPSRFVIFMVSYIGIALLSSIALV